MVMLVLGGYVLTDYGCPQLQVVFEYLDTVAMVTRETIGCEYYPIVQISMTS